MRVHTCTQAEAVLKAAEDLVRKAEDEARCGFVSRLCLCLCWIVCCCFPFAFVCVYFFVCVCLRLFVVLCSAADAELKRQQDELENKKNELDGKSKNTSLGAVARNKAAQELAQLRSQVPTTSTRIHINSHAHTQRRTRCRCARPRSRRRPPCARSKPSGNAPRPHACPSPSSASRYRIAVLFASLLLVVMFVCSSL